MLQLKNIDLAFSEKAKIYDSYGKSNPIVSHSRQIIRKRILSNLKKGDNILELNGGTGSDALYFVKHGFQVHMIDISQGMIEKSKSKMTSPEINQLLTVEKKSFENLSDLPHNSFDYIFSNFGGLNCTSNVKTVIDQFSSLLKSGGFITLVIMPPFCPWELANFFWNPKMALRRLPAIFGTPIKANVSGFKFWTYYYSANQILKLFDSHYKVISHQSISLFSPPSFLDYFPFRYPKLFNFLIHIDNKLSMRYPFNRWGDFFILTLKYESNRKK